MLQESKTSRVVRVVIVGSASPEGTLAFNDRLAWNRAVALKDFLLRNTAFPADSMTLFNGSEDWRGLRRMVAASDLYEREEILRIIDNVPVKKGRELELMKLSGGRPYLYMLEHMFPELRNAAFIKVYYENLPDPAAEALATGGGAGEPRALCGGPDGAAGRGGGLGSRPAGGFGPSVLGRRGRSPHLFWSAPRHAGSRRRGNFWISCMRRLLRARLALWSFPGADDAHITLRQDLTTYPFLFQHLPN